MRNRFYICLIIIFVLGAYYPTLFAPLNSIDDPGLYSQLLNTEYFDLRSIFLPGGTGSYYRPLLILSFLIDKYAWGLVESFMHLNNILIHLINSILVFMVAHKATDRFLKPSPVVPFLAALFFAIHPINTEAVNWISGRTDLLAGFFLLVSMYFMLNEPLTWNWSLLSAFCMLLACFSKETSIFFLPAALFYPFFMTGSGSETSSIRYVFHRHLSHFFIFCSTGVVYFMLRSFAFSKGDQGVARVIDHVGGTESLGILINARLVLKAIGFYAKKLLIPFPLNFGIIHVSDVYLPIGLLVLVGFLWLITRRTLPSFFITCAGAIGTSALMIPLLNITWTPLGERYMYIPSAFFLIGVTLAVIQWKNLTNYKHFLLTFIMCVVIISLYGTVTRNILWQDNLALFQDTLRKSPDFVPAQNEIAIALKQKGRLEESLEIFKKFEKKDGLINFQYGLVNKAGAFAANNEFDKARDILRDVLQDPGKHEILILEKILEINKLQLLCGLTTSADVYDETVKCLVRLFEITGDPFYQYRLGVVHLHEKNRALALNSFVIVTETASPSAYYYKPAAKLAHDLSNQ